MWLSASYFSSRCLQPRPLTPATRPRSPLTMLLPSPALQVFGKTLVCRNLDIAAKVARETDLSCVTMEGDQVGGGGWGWVLWGHLCTPS